MNNGIELREETPGRLVLRGHPSVSEVWYPVGHFEEKVNRGTWKGSLGQGPDCVLLENHAGIALARTKAGNLALSEDTQGLFCEAELDATTPRVQNLRSAVENCGLQMSVGFFCKEDEWSEDGTKRELKSASLHKGDVTLCNFGANPATDAMISERDNLSVAERRNFAEQMSGARECRMAPIAYSLGAGSTIAASRGGEQIAVPEPPSVTRRSQLELARAYAAKGSEGNDSSPYGSLWVITTSGDVERAVVKVELGRAKGAKEAAIKAYIVKKAAEIGASSLIPSTNWSAARSRRTSHVEIAKAYAVKGTRAATMPAHAHVAPRYSYAEIQALGKEGKAHKRKDGKYNFPIVDERDLLDAVYSIGKTPPAERLSVKRWIVYRARLLGLKSHVPGEWVVEVGEAVTA
jgi:HK97 family phage prohead protease